MDYSNHKLRNFLMIPLIAMAGFSAGCLRFSEQITILENGQAEINVTVSDLPIDYDASVAMPGLQEWEVTRREDPADPKNQILQALKTILPGGAFPSSFADSTEPFADQQLQFPTSIKSWSRDNTTFYEFTRDYQARRMARFEGNVVIDEDLEDRILENGIFAASEEDRGLYLDLLAKQTIQHHQAFLLEAVGSLLVQGIIELEDHQFILESGNEILTESIRPEMILEAMALDDEAMAQALEQWVETNTEKICQVMETRQAGSGPELEKNLADVARECDISFHTGNHHFHVDLNLPGTIISTNGLIDPLDPGHVSWDFKGEDLFDRGIPLHAVSAVRANEGSAHEQQ